MTRLRVWAPYVRRVSARVGTSELPLRALGDGHFETDQLEPDTDYTLRLDDGPERADPRSRWQPRGVHGPSQQPSDAFVWHDQGFRQAPLSEALLYELHVGTFTPEGSYEAVARHLPHLRSLGVTHVELMPLATFPGDRGWGYDGVNLFAPHPAYSTPEQLKQLVASCHAHGLAVVIDVVYNHLGPDGNHLAELGPYFNDEHQTPWGPAINLDGPGHEGVRRFLIDNALMWLRDYHFDALRLDAIHALRDDSSYKFLRQLADEVHGEAKRLGRAWLVIAESNANDASVVRPAANGGLGLDAHWSDDFHHALHALLTGERAGYYAEFGTLELLARMLQHGYAYDGSPEARDSAPRPRSTGASTQGVSGQRFVCALQNHDQIGNRACGERIGMLVSEGRARIGAALLFTSPFVPLLFQGEEWNASTPFLYFTDHQSPELARAVREGRRREFAAFVGKPEDVPDPQAKETFERSILRWQELETPRHDAMLQWYRALAQLRASHPELRDGRRDALRVRFDEARGWLELQRGTVTLQVNVGEAEVTLPKPAGKPVLAYPDRPLERADGVVLAPEGCCVWTLPVAKRG